MNYDLKTAHYLLQKHGVLESATNEFYNFRGDNLGFEAISIQKAKEDNVQTLSAAWKTTLPGYRRQKMALEADTVSRQKRRRGLGKSRIGVSFILLPIPNLNVRQWPAIHCISQHRENGNNTANWRS